MLTVLVHSKPFEVLGNSMKLYYYCRALDNKGEGRVVINRYECLDNLRIAKATFYRYIKDSRLFRHTEFIEGSDGDYIIYYKSIKAVCAEQGIRELGGITELDVKELSLWRQFCTLAQALDLQKQSRYMAQLHAKFRHESVNFFNEDELFEVAANCRESQQPSDTWVGALVNEWRIFFDTQEYTPYGASLDGIAKRIGRTSRTVGRRLKEFPKIHQCITRPEYTTHYSFKFIDEEDVQNNLLHYFQKSHPNFGDGSKIFRSYTNLYLRCIDTFSMRNLRKRVQYRTAIYEGEQVTWAELYRSKKPDPSYKAIYHTKLTELDETLY